MKAPERGFRGAEESTFHTRGPEQRSGLQVEVVRLEKFSRDFASTGSGGALGGLDGALRGLDGRVGHRLEIGFRDFGGLLGGNGSDKADLWNWRTTRGPHALPRLGTNEFSHFRDSTPPRLRFLQ